MGGHGMITFSPKTENVINAYFSFSSGLIILLTRAHITPNSGNCWLCWIRPRWRHPKNRFFWKAKRLIAWLLRVNLNQENKWAWLFNENYSLLFLCFTFRRAIQPHAYSIKNIPSFKRIFIWGFLRINSISEI